MAFSKVAIIHFGSHRINRNAIYIPADISNWNVAIPPDEKGYGDGGFFPYGIDGMIKGSTLFLFVFVAFDLMTLNDISPNGPITKGQVETFNKVIPISIITVNSMIFVCLFGVAVTLTLIQPYYLLVCIEPSPITFGIKIHRLLLPFQNNQQPFPDAFNNIGWHWMSYLILVCGLISLFGW